MRTRLLHLWDELTSSYWFVPTAMLVLAAAGAIGTLWVDRHWTAPTQSTWIYTGGPAGARSLLSAVAGSVITVAGVVFSITIATLVQASSQFGPRLLRNFMRDTGNQLVLGTFVATFVYCLLVLRSIRGEESYSFVPNVSVTVAVAMAIGSIGVLIFFFDHVSRSMQGPLIVAAVGAELERAIDKAYPADLGTGHPAGIAAPQADPPARPEPAVAVVAPASGYLQAVDADGLLGLATEADLMLRLSVRPGDYVTRGTPLLHCQSRAPLDEPARRQLAGLFILGRQRTAEQDVEYAVRQLVEIAVRALSPGINDPFTAVNCVDWLGAALAAAARHGLPGPNRYDDAGHLRVVANATTFDGLVSAALDQVRQYGADSVAVTIRLLEMLATLGPLATDPARRAALARQAELVYGQSRSSIPADIDKADVRDRYDRALAALAVGPRQCAV